MTAGNDDEEGKDADNECSNSFSIDEIIAATSSLGLNLYASFLLLLLRYCLHNYVRSKTCCMYFLVAVPANELFYAHDFAAEVDEPKLAGNGFRLYLDCKVNLVQHLHDFRSFKGAMVALN